MKQLTMHTLIQDSAGSSNSSKKLGRELVAHGRTRKPRADLRDSSEKYSFLFLKSARGEA